MKINNPHDTFFKATFGDVQVAQHFLQQRLPSYIQEMTAFHTLEPQKETFINEALQERFSDLLFKAHFKDKTGYFYFLLEHKSNPEKGIVLQLLTYMLQIWGTTEKKEDKSTLPLVIPLVMYHGKKVWNSPRSISDMINNYDNLPNEAKRFIPNFEYLVYNFSNTAEADDVHIQIKIYRELATKAAYMEEKQDFFDHLTNVFPYFADMEDEEKAISFLTSALWHIFSVAKNVTITDAEKLRQMIEKSYPKGSEAVMTLAEILREEGKQEGKQEGKEEGKEAGKREVAKKLMNKNYSVEVITDVTGLAKQEVEQLAEEK